MPCPRRCPALLAVAALAVLVTAARRRGSRTGPRAPLRPDRRARARRLPQPAPRGRALTFAPPQHRAHRSGAGAPPRSAARGHPRAAARRRAGADGADDPRSGRWTCRSRNSSTASARSSPARRSATSGRRSSRACASAAFRRGNLYVVPYIERCGAAVEGRATSGCSSPAATSPCAATPIRRRPVVTRVSHGLVQEVIDVADAGRRGRRGVPGLDADLRRRAHAGLGLHDRHATRQRPLLRLRAHRRRVEADARLRPPRLSPPSS